MFRGFSGRIKRLYRWFKKPKTTVLIIIVLSAIFALGLFVPQKRFFQSSMDYEAWLDTVPLIFPFLDWIGFTDIYLSPITLIFIALFFLNLIAVTLDRMPLLVRQAHIGGGGMPPLDSATLQRNSGVRAIRTVSLEKMEVIKLVEGYFRKGGWFVLEKEGEGEMLAVKNRLSVFGFLFFHLSFLLLLTGGLLIFYSRMTGSIALTQGEHFTGDMQQFRKISRKPKIMERIKIPPFFISDVGIGYEGDRPKDLILTVNIASESGERIELAEINKPIRLGNVTLLANNAGVSPLFILRDTKENREIDGAWVRLNVLNREIDNFTFRNSSTVIYDTWFYPDYVMEDGYEKSRSKEIRNPAFHILVRDRGVVIAEATIKKGQAMLFDSYMLIFEDIRYWGEIKVVREVGPPLLIAGFFLGIMGLIMRLMLYRREIRIAVNDDTVYFVGKSTLNQIACDERLEKMVGELRGLING